MEKKEKSTAVESVVERQYWRGVAFLIILILTGTGFWCLRYFNPALFLGKPDLFANPNDETSINRSVESVEANPKLLNINSASVEELQTLPSIGPQTAEKIIQYREEHGDFPSIHALTDVKGIGEKTLDKVKHFINAE